MVPWFVSNVEVAVTGQLVTRIPRVFTPSRESARKENSIQHLTLSLSTPQEEWMIKPVPLSEAKNLNRYQRVQTKLKFSNLFPKPRRKGKCRCGCSKKVKAPRRLWATSRCNHRAYEYYAMIKGSRKIIRKFLWRRDKGICAGCGKDCGRRDWDADHILSVAEGGGGCDLTNFQTLCKKCHKVKTEELMVRLRDK